LNQKTSRVAAAELLELVQDRAWLAKVTNTVNQHWHKQNARKKSPALNGTENEPIGMSVAGG
jgi:hypothetical protein